MAPRTVTMQIPGLRRRHDVRLISAAIQDLEGVITLKTDLAARRILVHGDVGEQEVREAVEATGYDVNWCS